MILNYCLAQIIVPILDQTAGILLGNYSKLNSSTLINCDQAFYQLCNNKTILVKGTKQGLINDDTTDFQNTNITNVAQLICYRSPIAPYLMIFGYITNNNQTFIEDTIVDNQLKFKETQDIPKDVMYTVDTHTQYTQIHLTFALTKSGIYAIGQCESLLCGAKDEGKTLNSFTLLQLDNSIQLNIKKISFKYYNLPGNYKNINILLIYLNNGDLYALGDNTDGFLPPAVDQNDIRKIGSNIKNPQMLYNLTLDESTLYYLNGTDLTQYNSSDKKTKIIETGVFNFHLILSDPQQDVNIFEYQVILVKEQQLLAIADKKFFASFVTHYCAMNPTNQKTNICN
ncbi:Hypothetical_protein [Hexamita inflata]|uniref:Hypothetical_protein n=1 Tax=Hexamita inflata TaxID=28002 RepID=A0AA86PIQ1_9EUKA|nr:Hypothetical protein HINF_LOCUS8524 [Hexamita inflata]CAI9939218.1 Hypothetical protein HINF_LOCUS26863 [Hexamita inflata]